MDRFPIWLLTIIWTLIVVLAVEGGFRLGRAVRRRAAHEEEPPVSTIAAAILALLAFIMAFTFSVVTNRYDARMLLLREEAAAIHTAYLRSDLLPEPARSEAVTLFKRYVDLRLAAADLLDPAEVTQKLAESNRIQRQLWDMAIANYDAAPNPDLVALYMEGLNTTFNLQTNRIAVSLQMRIPTAIWVALTALVLLGGASVGYQVAITGSRRSWSSLMLAVAFSLTIILLILLDRPLNSYLTVSNEPLYDLRALIDAELAGQ